MAFDRAAAKQAGYTDEEIDAYLQSKKETAPMTDSAAANEPPAPTTQIKTSDQGMGAEAATMGMAAAPYLAPAAAGAAAALGGSKLYNVWKSGTEAAQELARAKMASEQGIMERAQAKAAGRAPGPVAPTTSPIVDASGRPITTAPAQTAAQAPKPAPTNILDKTTQMVRQLAANKVLNNAARLGGAAAFGLTPGNLGPQVPQSGPYRGMEINPNTGRPWTRQELEALR